MSEIKALYIVNNPITDFIEGFNQISKADRILYIKEAYKDSRTLMEAFIKEILESKEGVFLEKEQS